VARLLKLLLISFSSLPNAFVYTGWLATAKVWLFILQS